MNQPQLSNDVKSLTVNCPECGREAQSYACFTGFLIWHSDPGHNHDGNCRTFYMKCSRRHYFSVRVINTCPAFGCAWKGRSDCATCGYWLKWKDKITLTVQA